MKNITLFALFLLVGFSPLLAKADVIPNNSHPLDLCAKVVNIDNFPEISLFGVIIGPMSSSNPNVILKNNECINKGYKFNSINIYWNTKSKVPVVESNNLLIKNMDVYGGYVNESNPLIKETVEYSIVKSTSNKYSLQKTKIISEYNNSTPAKIEYFNTINTEPNVDNNYSKITKKLKLGMKNENEVKYLQKFLNKALIMSLTEDGSFGLKTKIAVMKFQKINNLTADGIVGSKTMALLNSLK